MYWLFAVLAGLFALVNIFHSFNVRKLKPSRENAHQVRAEYKTQIVLHTATLSCSVLAAVFYKSYFPTLWFFWFWVGLSILLGVSLLGLLSYYKEL